MKQRYFNKWAVAVMAALSFSLASCNKFLDVSPSNQIRVDQQFTDLQGFMDGMFGIYQGASLPQGYGTNLSFGLVDVLAQRYENKASQLIDFYGQAARYNYEVMGFSQLNIRTTIDDMWGVMYGSIAQANLVLENANKNPGVLSANELRLIKGESIGMRGFLHFDLLRLFAPAYLAGANAGQSAIPYMEKFTVQPQDKLTVEGVLNKCEADLKAAEELLSFDTSMDQIAANQGSTSADLFMRFRQNHLNYWAVKATLARLYLYKNDKVNALKYATEVINSTKFSFVTPTEINSGETDVNSDLTFTREHVFSFYVSGMKRIADSLFKNNAGDPKALGNYTDIVDLYSTQTKLNSMYEQTIAGYGTDLRSPGASKTLWNAFSANVVYTKKFYADNVNNVKQRVVPNIKLSEMYYIAAEASATPEVGVAFLNTVRLARLIPELPTTITETNLHAELLKEYRKEFYGEGQLWYYYKRRNTTTIPDGISNITMSVARYVLPFPLTEIEFGK